MNTLIKAKPDRKENTATKEEIKKAVSAAFKAAFKETGIASKDFTWFSNKSI